MTSEVLTRASFSVFLSAAHSCSALSSSGLFRYLQPHPANWWVNHWIAFLWSVQGGTARLFARSATDKSEQILTHSLHFLTIVLFSLGLQDRRRVERGGDHVALRIQQADWAAAAAAAGQQQQRKGKRQACSSCHQQTNQKQQANAVKTELPFALDLMYINCIQIISHWPSTCFLLLCA